MAAKRSRRGEETREEILAREEQMKATKQVALPEGMTLEQAAPLVKFVKSLRYDTIMFGASESFTRLLAVDPTIFDRFGEFDVGVVDEVVAFNEKFGNRYDITVGSWKQLAAAVPPSSVPHFYLLCHLLREMATTIHESTLHPNVAGSCLFSQCKELCYHAWELERCVETSSTWTGIAVQMKPIMRAIDFAKAHRLNLLTPEAAAAFEDRKKDKLADDLAGLVWLYSAFMFSCGRFKPHHQLAVGFTDADLKNRFAAALGFDDDDARFTLPSDCNVCVANPDPDRKTPLPTACLHVECDETEKSISFGFGGAPHFTVNLHGN